MQIRTEENTQMHKQKENKQTMHNPTPHLVKSNQISPQVVGMTATRSLIILMVGLPASGKSYLSTRLCRFFSFFHGIKCEIFNVGNYRRELSGTKLPASFYSPSNEEGKEQRNNAVLMAIEDLSDYITGKIDDDGDREEIAIKIAVLDATNHTKSRRKLVVDSLRKRTRAKIMIIEAIRENEEFLEKSIQGKIHTPDYEGVDPNDAIKDFRERRKQYAKSYEPVDENEGVSFMKIQDSEKYTIFNIHGFLPLKVVHFVINLTTLPPTVYLTRHVSATFCIIVHF